MPGGFPPLPPPSQANITPIKTSSPIPLNPISLSFGSRPFIKIDPETRKEIPLSTDLKPLQSSQKLSAQIVNNNTPPDAVSKIAKAFAGDLKTRPLHQINGKSCVTFKVQDKIHLLSKIKFVIVAKFSHGRPRLLDFHSFLSRMSVQGEYHISDFDVKHVFVEFHHFEDFVKIWLLKSVLINGFRVRFFQWTCDFNPAVETFMAPVWIHLPALPLFLFDEDTIISIASLFGKLLYIDPMNMEKRRVGYLSFCVAKDVRIKGLEGFWIEFVGAGMWVERFWQRVSYGTVPSYCSACLHLGHLDTECKLQNVGMHNISREGLAVELEGGEEVPVVKISGRLKESIAAVREDIASKVVNYKDADLDEELIEVGSNDKGDFKSDSFQGVKADFHSTTCTPGGQSSPKLMVQSVVQVPTALREANLLGTPSENYANEGSSVFRAHAGVSQNSTVQDAAETSFSPDGYARLPLQGFEASAGEPMKPSVGLRAAADALFEAQSSCAGAENTLTALVTDLSKTDLEHPNNSERLQVRPFSAPAAREEVSNMSHAKNGLLLVSTAHHHTAPNLRSGIVKEPAVSTEETSALHVAGTNAFSIADMEDSKQLEIDHSLLQYPNSSSSSCLERSNCTDGSTKVCGSDFLTFEGRYANKVVHFGVNVLDAKLEGCDVFAPGLVFSVEVKLGAKIGMRHSCQVIREKKVYVFVLDLEEDNSWCLPLFPLSLESFVKMDKAIKIDKVIQIPARPFKFASKFLKTGLEDMKAKRDQEAQGSTSESTKVPEDPSKPP